MVLPPVVDRDEFLSRIKRLGFPDPPFKGPKGRSREMFVKRGKLKVAIPNPHGKQIGRDDLKKFLRNADITDEEWHEAADKHYGWTGDDRSAAAADGESPRRASR